MNRREIKFRAWVNGHWVDWIPNSKTLGKYNEVGVYADEYETDSNCYIEQYIGLKDKNDEEIYEGDIVKILNYGTYEVFWRKWDSSFSLKPIDTVIEGAIISMPFRDRGSDYEVVGNIHENPELLEKKWTNSSSVYPPALQQQVPRLFGPVSKGAK